MGKDYNYSCVIAVLCNKEKNDGLLPTGKKARLFKEMVNYANQRNVLVYFFYRGDVDWRRELIRGYTWDNNRSGWIKKIYSFPDVVYNRIRYRRIERQEDVQNLLQRFEEHPRVDLFNRRFLNKWEVYQAISRHDEGAAIVPDTALYNRTSLKNFLNQYNEVYLKPVHGSLGKGIIKVISNLNGYKFAIAQKTRIHWHGVSSFENLYKQLESYEGVGENQYLVQRAINLARYQGRVFDLRTQSQKNGQGKWVITGAGVRIAGENRIVTHIPNGGSAASYEEILSSAFGSSKEQKTYFDKQLKHIGGLVPLLLEKELGINLAVLSMDIGIDSEGKMWVIEVNSKPSSFDETDIRKRHLKYLLDYCIYITKNNKK